MSKTVNEQIAMVCHEINKAYCEALGDNTQLPWDEAPQWQKDSAVNGVIFHLKHPNAQPQDSHNSWLEQKMADGWKYGEIKDSDKKEHPCFVPYDELPTEQKVKDFLFIAVVKSMVKLVMGYNND